MWDEVNGAKPRVERFEDLIAWQKARELAKRVYEATRTAGLSTDRGLASQMQRAAVSIMSNIAEGHGRGSSSEYHQFLVVAHGSCQELRSQLYVALDVGYLGTDSFSDLMTRTEETGRIIGGLRAAIARRKTK